MNRSLVIPAVGCLFAFAALLAILHGAAGREAAAEPVSLDHSPRSLAASKARLANDSRNELLSTTEAEQRLATLAGEYLRPWRQWETSPRHLYSRVAPRPIPSISAEVAMSPGETGESGSFLLATIAVRTGAQSQPIPCVVDRATKQVRLFSAGQWLSEAEWLKQAPSP